MTSEMRPGFSKEEVDSYKNWLLPDVSSSEVLPAVAKEKTNSLRKKNLQQKEQKPLDAHSGESVEIIEELVSPLTADQLQDISDAAHKEGFESGYQAGLEAGKEEGLEKGTKEGFNQGLDRSKQAVSDQCEQLQHIIDALLIPLESEQNQLQKIILDMVSELSKAVVLRELMLDSSHITDLVESALSTIPVGADKFSLYLNAQDVDLVESYLSEFKERNEASLVIHIDDNLLPGGCRLETKQTVVDYSVEQRLKTIIDGFIHKRFVDHDRSNQANVNEGVSNQDDSFQENDSQNSSATKNTNIKSAPQENNAQGNIKEKNSTQEKNQEPIENSENDFGINEENNLAEKNSLTVKAVYDENQKNVTTDIEDKIVADAKVKDHAANKREEKSILEQPDNSQKNHLQDSSNKDDNESDSSQ